MFGLGCLFAVGLLSARVRRQSSVATSCRCHRIGLWLFSLFVYLLCLTVCRLWAILNRRPFLRLARSAPLALRCLSLLPCEHTLRALLLTHAFTVITPPLIKTVGTAPIQCDSTFLFPLFSPTHSPIRIGCWRVSSVVAGTWRPLLCTPAAVY